MNRIALIVVGLILGAALHASANNSSQWELISNPQAGIKDVRYAYVSGFANALWGLKNIVGTGKYDVTPAYPLESAHTQLILDIVKAGDCAYHLAPRQMEQFLDQHQGDDVVLVRALMHCATSIQ